MTFRCNDIVVARFPYVEGDRFTPRPSLVLSDADFNATHAQIIVAMITTASRSLWPSDVQILDFRSAGLKRPSLVRWKIFTLSKESFGPHVGTLSSQDHDRVAAARGRIFDDRQAAPSPGE